MFQFYKHVLIEKDFEFTNIFLHDIILYYPSKNITLNKFYIINIINLYLYLATNSSIFMYIATIVKSIRTSQAFLRFLHWFIV